MVGDVNGYALRQIDAALKQHEASECFEARNALFDMLVAAYEDELSDAFARAGKLLVERAERAGGEQ
jgi:hypothetical protein